jgi:gas vesicle protein
MANRTQAYLKGFLFGSIVGAAAALIMAPQPGEQTRAQMGERAIELRQRAETRYIDMQSRVDETMSELRANLDRIASQLDRAVVQSRARVAEEVTKVADEIAPE